MLNLKERQKSDFEKVIELTTKFETEESGYRLYLHRGLSYQHIKKNKEAKKDLLRALDIYRDSPKFEQDTHELKELKTALKEIG